MVTFRKKKNINIMRVVGRIAAIILGLYIGGYFIIILGQVMNGTCSPMYKGLQLIGWTVGSATCSTTSATNANTITATSNSGILGVMGLIALAGVILQFVEVQF